MQKTTRKLYVAYGSNLHPDQMRRRCPDAEICGSGVIRNYDLTFWADRRGNGFATIVPKEGNQVPAGVWEISGRDELALDRYEGFPYLYRKEEIEVELQDGSVITGMVYIMNEGRDVHPALPSSTYYDVIAYGYETFGFDLSVLKAARDNLPG